MMTPPQHVMRFYGNTDYALESLGFREIAFLHCDKLNDPFDPPFDFITDFNGNYEDLLAYVQQYHKNDIQTFKDTFRENDWDNFLYRLEMSFKSIRDSMFIFSTSAVDERKQHPKENLYMWGHYGNGHRGVAFEFDTTLLTRAILEKSKSLSAEGIDANDVWSKINYPPERPKITCESIFKDAMNAAEVSCKEDLGITEFEKIINKMFRSKSRVWEKEDEWRLMWKNNETKLKNLRLNLLEDTITSVYLGCLVNDPLKDDFVFEAKRSFPKAKVFHCKKAKGEFELIFEQLS